MRAATLLFLTLTSLIVVGFTGFGLGQESHPPITISTDADFTAANGIRSGTGTRLDPYVISNWFIDAEQSSYCIRVENVSKAFVISDCVLAGSSRYAVELIGAERGAIVDSCISDSLLGVLWKDCFQCTMRGCSICEVSWEAVSILESSACEVSH